MELLIVILLTWYGMGRYALHPTARQRDKHAHQRHMERMKRRGGTPTLVEAISIRLAQRIAESRADHGVGRFMLEWWSDSWAYATERRRDRHERARRGELRRQKAARAVGRVLGRGARAGGRHTWRGAKAAGRGARAGAKAAGQKVRDRRNRTGQTDTGDDPGEPTSNDPDPGEQPDPGPATGDPGTAEQPDPAATSDDPGPGEQTDPAADTQTGQEADGKPETVWADAEVLHTERSDAEPVDAEVVEDDQRTEPAAKAPGEPVCSFYGDPVRGTDCPNDAVMHVIYKDRADEYVCDRHFAEHFKGPHTQLTWADIESVYRRTPGGAMRLPGEHYPTDRQLPAANPGKEIAVSAPTTHNVTSGETVDPAAAKSFVNGVKGVADGLVSQIEQSIASLTSEGVSGEPIDHLRRMEEAAHTLSGNSAAAESHFDRHINTQDQVLSDPTVAGTVQNKYLGNKS